MTDEYFDMREKIFGWVKLETYPLATEHNLEALDKGYTCKTCRLSWAKGKPRLKCIGYEIVKRKQDILPNEYSKDELRKEEIGEVSRVLMLHPPDATRFIFLYHRKETSIDLLIHRYVQEFNELEDIIKKKRGKKRIASQTIRVETLHTELSKHGITKEQAIHIEWKKEREAYLAWLEDFNKKKSK